MTTKVSRQIGSGIAGTICVAAAIACFYFLGVPAIQSFSDYLDNRDRALTVPAHVVKAEQENTFRSICPRYMEASTWDRWTNSFYWDLTWCEDYKDRL